MEKTPSPAVEPKHELYARALRNTTRELETRIEELSVLRELGALFERSTDLERVTSYAMELLFRVSRAEQASILMVQPGTGELTLLAAASSAERPPTFYGLDGYPKQMFAPGEGVAGWCLSAGEPVFLDDARADPRFLPRPGGTPVGSLACLPLVVEGKGIGVLNLSHRDPRGLGRQHENAWSTLASYLAVAISHAMLFQQIRGMNRRLEAQVRERTRRLEAANRELARARAEVAEQNRLLQRRVEERTAELRTALEKLQAQHARLEEANRVKDEFLNNINHELKTPLNAIIGYAGLLLRELGPRLSEDHRTDLKLIEANGKHLQSILENIFCLKDIEAGHIEPDRVHTDLNELVLAAVGSIRPRAQEKGLEVTFEPLDVPPLLLDPTLILRVLYNLLDNAVKFSDRGTVRVRTRTARLSVDRPQGPPPSRDDGIQCAVVEVSDEGRGIHPDDVDRLFQKFQQGEPPTRKTEGGSGLGLTIAKNLVELHGGRIWVRSRPGAGSTFAFFLPLEHPPSD